MAFSYIHWLRQRLGPQKTIVIYVSVVPFDDQGRILLQRRADFDLWGLPGGVLEPDESLPACAARETLEETGLQVDALRLVGIYTDPKYDSTYPNGDQVQQFTICFAGRICGGELCPQPGESLALEYFAPADLPLTEMANFYVDMLHDALHPGPPAYEAPAAGPLLGDIIRQVRPLLGHDLYLGAGAMAAVLDDAGRLLTARRADTGDWYMPGGYLSLGENAAHCAVREVQEETGYQIAIDGFLGISAGVQPWEYSNGDRTRAIVPIFRAHVIGGEPLADGVEVTGLRWMTPQELVMQGGHPILVRINRAVVRALQSGEAGFIL